VVILLICVQVRQYWLEEKAKVREQEAKEAPAQAQAQAKLFLARKGL